MNVLGIEALFFQNNLPSINLFVLGPFCDKRASFVDELFMIFIDKNNIKTLIKFDKKKFLLAGWTSFDQYNNQIAFEIEITSLNQMINNNVFTLPSKG